MADTNIIRYWTRDGKSSTREAGNPECAPRTGNNLYPTLLLRFQKSDIGRIKIIHYFIQENQDGVNL